MSVVISVSMDRLCPKDVVEGITDVEQILAVKIEMVSKEDSQLTGKENNV